MKHLFYIDHLKAVPGDRPDGQVPFDWIVERDKICGPIAQLEELCTHEMTRSINWPQTFARKHLPYEHYVQKEIKRYTGCDYKFVRRKGAPRGLPARVEFDWTVPEDEGAALQGDVLTYEHTTLSLKAISVGEVRGSVKQSDFEEYEKLGWVFTDRSVFEDLYKRIFKSGKTDFKANVLDNWDSSSLICMR